MTSSLSSSIVQRQTFETGDANVRAIGQSFRSGQQTSVALTQGLIARAQANSDLNALTYLASEAALAVAARCDATLPNADDKQPLLGIPFIVKDNIDVAGMPTTAGSHALKGNVPTKHATVVQRVIDAGAVVLGKANMHELAFGITSNNAAYGSVRNPHAPTHIPGGSSGGNASALAAGFAPLGLGSDTGGSLRIPAALCGVVGFRPSTGRWPADGVVCLSPTRDTAGPMARNVADCALLDAVVCQESLTLPSVALKNLRLGRVRQPFWSELDPEVEKAAHAALDRLQKAGAQIIDCELEFDVAQCAQSGMVLVFAECLPALRDYFEKAGLAFDTQGMLDAIASPDVKGIFEHLMGDQVPSQLDWEQAIAQRKQFQSAYSRCMAKHKLDAFVLPTTPLPATPIGQDATVQLLGKAVPTFEIFTRNATLASVIGAPGLSLPMGRTASGLPLGLELDGDIGADRHLLAVALAVESALPPAQHLNSF